MAVLQKFIKISDDFGGTGPNIPIEHIKTYEETDEPPYSGGSQPGAGTTRFVLRFLMVHPYDSVPLDWVFTTAQDRTDELALVDAALAETLSSD